MRKIIISLFALVIIYSCTPLDAPNTVRDGRDDKVYKTVTIGNQVWMAENLAYLPSIVGSGTGSEDDGHEADPCYYVYGYDGTNIAAAKATDNYTTYGVLYNWPAALTACPEGWHLPTDEEWTQLETYLANNGHNYDGSIGGDNVRAKIAKSMASETGWSPSETVGVPGNTDYPAYRNKSGFSALPGGARGDIGTFYAGSAYGYWWSSTEYDPDCALDRSLYFYVSPVYRSGSGKAYGFSVRCIKD